MYPLNQGMAEASKVSESRFDIGDKAIRLHFLRNSLGKESRLLEAAGRELSTRSPNLRPNAWNRPPRADLASRRANP